MAFICERCKREFKSKGGLTKHGNRKVPCSAKTSPHESPVYEELENSVGKGLYDLLRSDGIVGIDAFKQINILLTFKLLERRLSTGEIEIPQLEEDDPTLVREAWESKLYLWSNFIKRSDSEWFVMYLLHIFEKLRDNYELQLHLPNPREIKIEKTITLVKICDVIDELDVTGDSFGDVYENMLSRQMMGKDLGQFFTPYWVRKWVIEEMNLQRDEGGELPTVYDPAAGTGGFLTSALRWFKKIGPVEGAGEKLFGVELNENTYRSGLTHLFIATGENPTNTFVRGNSLGDHHGLERQRFDYILSNPPFGVKETWETTTCPIKTNSGTSLFLQQIIRYLKVGGRAGVVFPMGKELSSDRDLEDLRILLMKCCELESVTKLPKATFLNAGIATCVLVFTKRCEIEEVLTCTKKGKTQKRSFVEGAYTREVMFNEIVEVPEERVQPVVKELKKITIEEIVVKGWSLRLEDYGDQREFRNEEGWPVEKLGDLCTFKNGENITKSKLIDGPFPVVGGGRSPMGMHEISNVEAGTILISKDGAYAGFVSRYETPVFVTNHGIFIESITDKVDPDYLFYSLKFSVQDELHSLQRGMAQPGIKISQIIELRIVVPPMEKQLEIVRRFMSRLESRENDIELYKEDKVEIYRLFQARDTGQTVKLKDLCSFESGKMTTKSMDNAGEIPFFNCSAKNPIGTHSTFSFDYPEQLLFIKDGGSENNRLGENVGLGKVLHVKGPAACTNGVICMRPKTEGVNIEYLYLVLRSRRPEIVRMAHFTTNLGHVEMKRFKELEVSVPPMEEQLEAVKKVNERIEVIETRIAMAREEIDELREELKSLM